MLYYEVPKGMFIGTAIETIRRIADQTSEVVKMKFNGIEINSIMTDDEINEIYPWATESDSQIGDKDIEEQIKSKIHKVCTNLKPVYKDNGQIQVYLRPDLTKWAEEMASTGKKYFYTEPVDPNNWYGKLRLCEPKYEYRVESLTQEEYDVLKELLNGGK